MPQGVKGKCGFWLALVIASVISRTDGAAAPDKLVGIHSARVMSQSMPWMATEAGLFKKYNIDFNLVFISSSSIVTAALLGGDAEMTVTGGIGNVAAYLRGSTDLVFTGGGKKVKTPTTGPAANDQKPDRSKGPKKPRTRGGGHAAEFET